MSRVNVLVEGQTEQAFIRQLLTPALSAHECIYTEYSWVNLATREAFEVLRQYRGILPAFSGKIRMQRSRHCLTAMPFQAIGLD